MPESSRPSSIDDVLVPRKDLSDGFCGYLSPRDKFFARLVGKDNTSMSLSLFLSFVVTRFVQLRVGNRLAWYTLRAFW